MSSAAWMTPAEEAAALRRAASRSGCRVGELVERPTVLGVQTTGQVGCRNGWDAARFLLALAVEDSRTAGARDLALSLRRSAPADLDFAAAVQRFVQDNVAFVREPGEVFTGASYTLATAAGDCDDQARVVYALLRAGGLPARLAFLHRKGGDGPSHVLAAAGVGGRWYYLETTIPARFGEHPIDAGRRLGVLSSRSDLSPEVILMSESDLPPPPPQFDTRNPGELLAADARALAALAGLDELCTPPAASDPEFRGAVAGFQRLHGLQADGLIGPHTRAAILAELRAAGLGELADGYQATIDGVTPETFSHATAQRIVRSVFPSVFGRDATDNEVIFACAIAYAETGYGRAPGQFADFASRGIYNWGALEHGTPPCGPGFVEGKDAARPVCFYAFDTDEDAARAFLQTWGKPDTLAAAQTGDAGEVAAAMKRHGYYEGFWVPPGNPQHKPIPPFKVASSAADAEARNVADYAAMITNNVRAVTGGGGIPNPPRRAGVGALALLLLAGAAAYYAHTQGYLRGIV